MMYIKVFATIDFCDNKFNTEKNIDDIMQV